MIAGILITILWFCFLLLGVLFFYLNKRVEKLASKVSIIVQWCDTLRENEETIMGDVKRLRHEFQILQKDSETRR